MGPLHGGGADCQADDLMYFTSINYPEYAKWLQSRHVHVKVQKIFNKGLRKFV